MSALSASNSLRSTAWPEEIIFGNNMTMLTLQPGDKLLVTRLDHDANISPWTILKEPRKRSQRSLPLVMPRIYWGTVNHVKKLTQMAKEAGAQVYIDAVQYVPHGAIDVQDIDCDFLVCSSYKYCRTKTTRLLQFHSSPGHRKDKTLTLWNQIPKWVIGYNQRLSPISFSEYTQ